ncbi:MAG: putative methyltransferase-domain-containing protein [Lentinula lateritia]|uniref:Methyltransferase-domain-containing protein n=1 Tax=Lentinula lateritia TaxID=40482 RepID=A0ABQ8V7M4_9AGAR|nr:MAG: putative methyltransferase-domain-containing protein [Lentinula lateritia]KAJ4477930.1 putative methyltransferase-domain-containing protein [Lentinula lateritia]
MDSIRWEMFTLLRDYASLVPARFIQIPSNVPYAEINRFLVELLVLNPHFQKYPPSKQYQRSFWKMIIGQLEDILTRTSEEDEEIDPRILDHYLSVFSSSGPLLGTSAPGLRGQICDRGLPLGEVPSKSFVTHFWEPKSNQLQGEFHPKVINLASHRTFTLEESRTTIEGGTTGFRTWFASRMLASYLIQNPGIIEGKRVLELGSGIGFLGIIAASLQQLSPKDTSSLWLTDVNEEVLSQCRHNIQLSCNVSSTHKSVQFRVLDWEEALRTDHEPLVALLRDEINPDVILGADIVFDPSLVPPLISLIALALQLGPKNGIQRSAIITLTIRNAETFRLFMNHAEEKGLSLEDIILPQAQGFEFIDAVEATDNDVRALRITL